MNRNGVVSDQNVCSPFSFSITQMGFPVTMLTCCPVIAVKPGMTLEIKGKTLIKRSKWTNFRGTIESVSTIREWRASVGITNQRPRTQKPTYFNSTGNYILDILH